MKYVHNISKILYCFFLGIFMVSFSITSVILLRPYYYLNIRLLDLEHKAGYSYEVIKEAYDDVMDYLVFGEEFKTGELTYSKEGESHFKDCKKLFTFNFICLFTSFSYILIFFILNKLNIYKLKYNKLSPSIYSTIGIGSVALLLLIWGSIDFSSLFTAFHKVFFPGKDNWSFNIKEDQIIKILPTQLWINFSILIIFILAIFITSFIMYEYYKKTELSKKTQE